MSVDKPSLDPDVADRLVKLLGMLGSDQPGERAAAALKAHELLRRQGLRWSDVIQARIAVADDSDGYDDDYDDGDDDWRAMARECCGRAWALSAKELAFVRTMERWRGEPSDRQLDWLESIHARIGGGR